MNTHLLALQLMAAQALLGAFDTLYHHELSEALPQRDSARRELGIHACRALLYAVLFIGLSAWEWHGIWAAVLMLVFGIEIALTLWDFAVEDRTRLLPASERITHTVLAINGGAFIALLALTLPAWWAQPAGLAWAPQGWLSVFLALAGVGVAISGVRDALAAVGLKQWETTDAQLAPVRFGERPEHVLLTGGTGFIGQHLVRALLRDGHQVTLLTRNPKATAWLFDGRVQCIAKMDAMPGNQRVDVVVNLAGARILGWRWTARRKAALLASRVDLTRSVVAWIARAEHKPRLLVSASAIGYYGIQRQGDDAELAEDKPPQEIFMSRLCREWEDAAREAGRHGVAVTVMRLGLVLGHQGAMPMMLLPVRLGFGGPLGGGRQWLSWVHVYDVLRAIAHAWDVRPGTDDVAAAPRVYNLCAPQAVSQKSFNETAAQLLGRPAFIPTPTLPLRLALGEQADLLLEGQRVAPRNLLEEGFRFAFPDLRSALEHLLLMRVASRSEPGAQARFGATG